MQLLRNIHITISFHIFVTIFNLLILERNLSNALNAENSLQKCQIWNLTYKVIPAREHSNAVNVQNHFWKSSSSLYFSSSSLSSSSSSFLSSYSCYLSSSSFFSWWISENNLFDTELNLFDTELNLFASKFFPW